MRGEILCACGPERFTTAGQLAIELAQNTQAELAIAFNRHDACVWQAIGGIGFELYALLEVDEMEFNFARRIPQRGAGDQDMQQGRLARAGAAADQHMLRGAATQLQHLQPIWPAFAKRNRQALGGRFRPQLRGAWGNRSKAEFHPLRPIGSLADGGDQVLHQRHGRRSIRAEGPILQPIPLKDQAILQRAQDDAGAAEPRQIQHGG